MTAAPAIWLQTIGGARYVDLANPKPEQINFEAMATVLARVPRFGGHTNGIYSVAQHCVEGAYAILRDTGRRDAAAAFLLHDGHEYLIGDIATPVQEALAAAADVFDGDRDGGDIVRCAIGNLKARLDAAIYAAAGIAWPLPKDVRAIVKDYDMRMCATEHRARMDAAPFPWVEQVENAASVVGCDLAQWDEWCAHDAFQSAFYDLVKQGKWPC